MIFLGIIFSVKTEEANKAKTHKVLKFLAPLEFVI